MTQNDPTAINPAVLQGKYDEYEERRAADLESREAQDRASHEAIWAKSRAALAQISDIDEGDLEPLRIYPGKQFSLHLFTTAGLVLCLRQAGVLAEPHIGGVLYKCRTFRNSPEAGLVERLVPRRRAAIAFYGDARKLTETESYDLGGAALGWPFGFVDQANIRGRRRLGDALVKLHDQGCDYRASTVLRLLPETPHVWTFLRPSTVYVKRHALEAHVLLPTEYAP